MSLILEALRKSEAERRRGETPSVYSELPPSPRSSKLRFARASGWALVACVALASLWGIRALMTRASGAPAVHAGPATPVAKRKAPPAPPLPVVRHLTPAPVVRDMAAQPEQPSPSQQAPGETGATKTATIAPTIPAPAFAQPPVAPPATASPNDDMLRLSDLGPDARKALPPLKLSMHMWNSDPSQRFVILDGNRVREGDRIGDAVVTAITSDGVVLDWNGRRLKLPIR